MIRYFIIDKQQNGILDLDYGKFIEAFTHKTIQNKFCVSMRNPSYVRANWIEITEEEFESNRYISENEEDDK